MAKNFSGKDRIELCAKSLISLVYGLLARHSSNISRFSRGTVTYPQGMVALTWFE